MTRQQTHLWCYSTITVSVILVNVMLYCNLNEHLIHNLTLWSKYWNKTPNLDRDALYSTQDNVSHALPDNETRKEPEGQLTLFTSMRDDVGRLERNMNTFLNWDALYPAIRPVLFIPQNDTNNTLPNLVHNLTKHWKVLETPDMISGKPVLKGMFKVIEHVGHKTPFIGFANGDILFDKSILKTLSAILKWNNNITSKYTLLTGRRRNIDLLSIPSPTCLDCFTKIVPKTELFVKFAQDYFITSKAGFPWNRCPNHVIGDVAYDNWLLGAANSWSDVTVIDGSMTINAFHETGKDGNYSGHRGEGINIKLTPKHERFYMFIGRTGAVKLKTWPQMETCPRNRTCIPVDIVRSLSKQHVIHNMPSMKHVQHISKTRLGNLTNTKKILPIARLLQKPKDGPTTGHGNLKVITKPLLVKDLKIANH